MADKKPLFKTPVGFAKWAWVNEPKKNHFDPKKEPQFMIDVCFSPDDLAWRKWAGELKAAVQAVHGKNMPIKPEKDDNDNPTGRYFVTFKTGEKYPPSIFDKYGQPMTDLIGNESRVCIAYKSASYEGFGGGIALYLSAVQVVDLVEYKARNASAYGFDVQSAPPPTNTAAGGPPPPEDDLPF